MTERAQELALQYAMLKGKINTVLHRFEDALDEDYAENADMFDRTREDFSQNPHPNRTLRALESDLLQEGEDFLLLLTALLEAGKELLLGLADYPTPAALLEGVATLFDELAHRRPSVKTLAHGITEIKAEHSARRLACMMEKLTPFGGY